MHARFQGPLIALLAFAACGAPRDGAGSADLRAAPAGDLSFAVISNTRIDPRPPGSPGVSLSDLRNFASLPWLSAALREEQRFDALELRAPPAQFALVCGNLTDSGAIGAVWEQVESFMASLGLPWFAVAGERDMNWAPVIDGFERRFGGLIYSFDRAGAHFVALCSATALEPTPSFSPLQLAWLRQDLASNGDKKPVFLFLQHAPGSEEFAPAQVLELRDALDGFEIAALFYGQGEAIESRMLGSLDCVRAGSTTWEAEPGSEDPRGYALATLGSSRIRVWFRFLDDALPPRLLLDKPLRLRSRAPFEIVEPAAGAPVRGEQLELAVRSVGFAPNAVQIDGAPRAPRWRKDGGLWCARIELAGLEGGVHQLAVEGDDDGASRLRTRSFVTASDSVLLRWRRQFQGALRSAPVFAAERLAIASSAGEVACLEPDTGELVWSARSSAAVLGSPLGAADGSVVVANTAGWVECFDAQGKPRWRFQLGAAAYAGLVGDEQCVYVADALGNVHAIGLQNGQRRWKSVPAHNEKQRGAASVSTTRRRIGAVPTGAAIEARPLLRDGRLWFGAWDGHAHALDVREGTRLWDTQGASSELAMNAREDSPADVSPAWTTAGVWFADAGGRAARFDAEGERTDFEFEPIAALSAAQDGSALNLRARADRLLRVDAQGKLLWSTDVASGTIPSAPCEADGFIAVVSDRGRVSLLDSATGERRWSWQATGGTSVLAAPLVAQGGNVWVAALDGSLSALRAR